MNKNFILIDKTNNVQKVANAIIKFNLEEKDYLIYSIDENEQNKQIFVSQIVLNSEGKYFIDNIQLEEKNKLSNIVYNMVILTPSNAKKGGEPANLVKELVDKFNLKLSMEIPELLEQEYFNNCSIAITGKEFVENAIEFYSENIIAEKAPIEENNSIPTWTIPTNEAPIEVPTLEAAEVVSPIQMQSIPDAISTPVVESIEPVIPVEQASTVSTEQVITGVAQPEPINIVPAEPAIVVPENNQVTENLNEPIQPEAPVVESNPQTVIMSDPSLGLNNNMQPNVAKKNSGFAINKYVVIGTACIIIAIAVVVVAYILIQKKINGA